MKFKSYTGITWSNLELTGLLEDEDSRVFYEKFKKHLGLHPFHLTNLNAALNEILSSNLNFYDPELKGFLLAYKNPKLLTPLGEIFYDTCFIHVDIEADFYIFRPEVGCSLKGVVNKKGLDHIGVLVHKAFNVSIPKPHDETNWVGDNLEIGQEVRFVVTQLDITSKLPFIRGVLSDDYLRGCKTMPKKHNKKTSNNDKNENSVENTIVKTPKGSKNSKKHVFFATDSEHSSDEDAVQIKSESFESEKTKKKSDQEAKKKEDRKRTKKSKVKEEPLTSDISVNGGLEANQELEESITPKKRVKTKSKSLNSQSSENEEDSETLEKYQSKKASKKLLHVKSKSEINDIKLEQSAMYSDMEQATDETITETKPKSKKKSSKSIDRISDIKLEQSTINSDSEQVTEGSTQSDKIRRKKLSSSLSDAEVKQEVEIKEEKQYREETMSESTVKTKKKAQKRKYLDEDENSADDFTTSKYITDSSINNLKNTEVLHADGTAIAVNIKKEKPNDTYTNEIEELEESQSKKKHKKSKHSVKLEIPEDEAVNTSPEKHSVKKRSKKSSISDSEPVHNVSIKREIMTSDSEIVQDEDHEQINKLDEDKVKKKRKKHSKIIDANEIKIEPEFEFNDVIIKTENSENIYDNYIAENIKQEDDSESSMKAPSPKKKRKSRSDGNATDTSVQNDLTPSKKAKATSSEVDTHGRKVKKEKILTNNTSEEDVNDTEMQFETKKKRSKSSTSKGSNRSRTSESELDFSDITIKTEKHDS
ncbi:RNA polymerase I subunit F [Calliopsis andreniformis]|uniref:RNA polymerase I subunit F n=1 Tax=Calliopsis andreniformis TaxID=337506 RepID=UPI003FCEA854